MKKMAKWIALLMAGLMLSATLLACDSAYTGSDDDDDEEEESFDEYKKLSPEEVGEALEDAKDYTVHTVWAYHYNGQNIRREYALDKDGNKLKLYLSTEGGDGELRKETQYGDLKKNYVYLLGEDNRWVAESTEIDLEDTLEEIAPVELFFDDENYGEYDSDAHSYPLNEEDVRNFVNEEAEEGSASGSMTRKSTTYTFTASVQQGEEAYQTIETVIRFKSVSVDLPKVDLPDEEDKDQPSVDDQKPAVTDDVPSTPQPQPPVEEPDHPQPPVEEPEEPSLPVPDSPSEVYERLFHADSAHYSIAIYSADNSVNQTLDILKNGDILLVTLFSGANTMRSYMDLGTGYLYTLDENGDWCKEYSESVVSWETLILQTFGDELSAIVDDSNYEYNAQSQQYYISDNILKLLSQLLDTELNGVTLNYIEPNTHFFLLQEYDSSMGTDLFTEISVTFEEPIVTLPDAYEKEEEPPFDSTVYENLTPGQLTQALLNTEEVYVVMHTGVDEVRIRRDRDVVCLEFDVTGVYTYYQNLSTKELYCHDIGDQYIQMNFSYTWEELITQILGFHEDLEFLQDDCYFPFDESSTELQLDPAVLLFDGDYATFRRAGAYYYFEGVIDACYISFTVEFVNQDVKMPV